MALLAVTLTPPAALPLEDKVHPAKAAASGRLWCGMPLPLRSTRRRLRLPMMGAPAQGVVRDKRFGGAAVNEAPAPLKAGTRPATSRATAG
jgi:hypothetical protein